MGEKTEMGSYARLRLKMIFFFGELPLENVGVCPAGVLLQGSILGWSVLEERDGCTAQVQLWGALRCCWWGLEGTPEDCGVQPLALHSITAELPAFCLSEAGILSGTGRWRSPARDRLSRPCLWCWGIITASC